MAAVHDAECEKRRHDEYDDPDPVAKHEHRRGRRMGLANGFNDPDCGGTADHLSAEPLATRRPRQ